MGRRRRRHGGPRPGRDRAGLVNRNQVGRFARTSTGRGGRLGRCRLRRGEGGAHRRPPRQGLRSGRGPSRRRGWFRPSGSGAALHRGGALRRAGRGPRTGPVTPAVPGRAGRRDVPRCRAGSGELSSWHGSKATGPPAARSVRRSHRSRPAVADGDQVGAPGRSTVPPALAPRPGRGAARATSEGPGGAPGAVVSPDRACAVNSCTFGSAYCVRGQSC